MSYPFIAGSIGEDGLTVSLHPSRPPAAVRQKKQDVSVFLAGDLDNADAPEDFVREAFRENGLAAFRQVRGDFIAVVADHIQGDIHLLGDPRGIYGLYYRSTDDGMVFSTRLRDLVDRRRDTSESIDVDALHSYFSLGIVIPPKTMFSATHSLEKGEVITWKQGSMARSRYAEPQVPGERIRDENRAIAGFTPLVEMAIRKRLTGKKRVGLFLSGGVDSAYLLALIARHHPIKDIVAVTLGVSEAEVEHASISAQRHGVRHVVVRPNLADLDMLPAVVSRLEQPNYDAAFAFHLMSSALEDSDIDIYVSGQNADTIMGSMPYVRYIQWARALQKLVPRSLRMALAGLADQMPARALRRRADFFLRERDLVDAMFYFKSKKVEEYASKLYPFFRNDRYEAVKDSIRRRRSDDAALSLADAIILLDERYTESPRCLEAMQKGVAGTPVFFPFYDADVVSYCLSVADSIRSRDNWGKRLLRRAARPLVDKRLYDKPPASLGLPFEQWFGERLAGNIGLLKELPFLARYVDVDVLESFIKEKRYDYGDLTYMTVHFACWYRLFVEGVLDDIGEHASLNDVLGVPLLSVD